MRASIMKRVFENKVIIKYLSSSFLSLPISLMVGILIFRKIDPYFMGVWATVAVFETYFNVLRIGIVNGMNRELPYSLGAGNVEEAKEYAQTTFAYTLSNISLIILVIPFLVYKMELNITYLSCIAVFLIKISLSFYNTYLTGTFRSHDHFNNLSNIQFIVLTTKLFLIPLILLGFNGYLLMEALLFIVNASLLHYYRPYRIKPKFILSAFRKLIKIGFPLFLTSYALTFIETLPRLYIVNYGNEVLMGLYAPIIMLLGAISLLPNSLTSYLYPKFSFHLGQKNDPKLIWKKLIKIYIVSISFITILIIIIYFSLDYFTLIFPKYADSLPYIKLSLLIYPFVLHRLAHTLNAVFKKYDFMILYTVAYAVIQLGTLFIFSKFNSDTLKIAVYSQIVTTFLLFIISIVMSYFLIHKYKSEIIPVSTKISNH